ncbi:double zinc ribbon domain-containing protein [Chloroflexota bacterium]
MANMLPQVAKLKEVAFDFLFPRWCLGCGAEGDFLCHTCREFLSEIMPPICPRCGIPQEDGTLCHSCTGWLWRDR